MFVTLALIFHWNPLKETQNDSSWIYNRFCQCNNVLTSTHKSEYTVAVVDLTFIRIFGITVLLDTILIFCCV